MSHRGGEIEDNQEEDSYQAGEKQNYHENSSKSVKNVKVMTDGVEEDESEGYRQNHIKIVMNLFIYHFLCQLCFLQIRFLVLENQDLPLESKGRKKRRKNKEI